MVFLEDRPPSAERLHGVVLLPSTKNPEETLMSIQRILLALLVMPLLVAHVVVAQTARVQIVHNSPYAEAASVDVYVNGLRALNDVAFRDVTEFLDLPAGVAVTIDITAGDAENNDSPVFTLSLENGLEDGATLIAIAAGDPLNRDGNPAFNLFIANALEAAATAGNVELLVFHGSPDAPTVDVVERTAGILVDDISFGEFSDGYLSVPPATYELDIQTADNAATAASFVAYLSGAADNAIAVLASGFLSPPSESDPGFGLLAVFADGTSALLEVNEPDPTTLVQVIHNSPYAEAAVVDVYVNGGLALDDVPFRAATSFLELPAETPVVIDITAPDAADNSAPVFTLESPGLPADAELLAIAAGDPLNRDGNPAFNIFITEARQAAVTSGNVEFTVFHGAPDAPTVDVIARGVGAIVDDLSFGEFTGDYLSVPAASYELDVQTGDNTLTAASFVADLSGAADAALAVLASGFLAPASDEDPAFGLLAVFPDGTTALLPATDLPMAYVQIVHNSPYAEAALVDIYVNDELGLDDVAFRDATPFIQLPASVPVTVDITGADAADNSAPVFSLEDAVLENGARLQVIAAGDPLARDGNPAFNLFITAANEMVGTAGNVEFNVFHGSPDAPTVDVVARGVGTIVDDISFGEFTADYLSVPPALYELDIQTADNTVTAASFGADLSGAADAVISVLASGFLSPASDSDPGFGLLAVFADGTTALLPAIDPPSVDPARVQVIHNSPYAEAAVVDVYINDGLALDDFAFRTATPYIDLASEQPIKIDITGADAADNSAPVFTFESDAGLPAGATLQLVAAGDPLARGGNPAFNLFLTGGQEAAATEGNVEFNVFHGSPDAPTVDVIARGVGAIVDDVSFGEFTDGYLSVPAALYELDIETADNAATAASFAADLSGAAGAALSVLASGFLAPASDTDPGFGLLAVFADGTTALLPALDEAVTFTLIDASANAPVAAFDPIPQNAILNQATLPAALSIRANLKEEAHSVVFGLNDNASFNTESFAPYALCGDISGNYFDCHLPVGDHVVTATSFSENGGAGMEIASGSIAFSIVNEGDGIQGFVLVDANTNSDIMPLTDGMTLDLSTLPSHLNVRADASDKVKSVRFELAPTMYSRTEVVPPYALFGDISSDYLGGSFETGSITLTATPFSDSNGGQAGTPLSIAFEVTGHHSEAPPVETGDHAEESSIQPSIALNDEADSVPATFALEGNYPNPFNPTTTIAFTLPESAPVRLSVFDMLGRQVQVLIDGNVPSGRTEVVFEAGGLPTGTYLYRLSTPQQTVVKKMMLVK